MNLRKNNGFTGIDISIAIIIVIIFAGVITTILYNFAIESKKVERKEQATSIMIDILEYAKGTNFENLTADYLKSYINSKYSNLSGYTIDTKCENETDVLQFNEINTDVTHVAKKVTVNVKYLVGKNEQNLDIYTWILNK